MAFVALFVSATKLAGILVTITVAANAFSFSRYRKKNLRPFRTPIDETSDVLAAFNIDSTYGEGGDQFFFGLATAPAHVEDRLNDAWLEFAEEQPCSQAESLYSPQPADALMTSATGDGSSQLDPAPKREPCEPKKKKKSLKIAMEAMIRGFEKYADDEEADIEAECSHNIAAWHNVPHP